MLKDFDLPWTWSVRGRLQIACKIERLAVKANSVGFGGPDPASGSAKRLYRQNGCGTEAVSIRMISSKDMHV
ncbi:hypothetical protein Trco_002568 [Trichoderma cornu-damae]|uniref:Uncharacterized protein n=1 Tax=Trichoderma cornu-damae TaxID=654480 RepID=A0A9P8QV84_9HYPO|nr:hypothetical protein Trco_002568 [Trichoderma cornu-damae]